MKCIVCGKPTKKKYAKSNFVDTYTYVCCTSCTLQYIYPQPTQQQLATYYNTAYAVQTVQEQKARQKAKRVLKNVPDKAHILEIGSSYGYFLDEASKQGHHVQGIELDKRAAAKSKTYTKNVHIGTVSTFKKSMKYDVIVMLDVIEHVVDIHATMAFVQKHLVKGGLFITTTPNSDSIEHSLFGRYWEWISPPAHTFLFNKKSYHTLMQQYSLKKRYIRTNKGDSAGNTFFHFFLTLRYLAAYGLLWLAPNYSKKLYNTQRKVAINQSNIEQKEFTGLFGVLHQLTSLLEPLCKPLQKKRGASLLCVYER